MVSIRVHKQDGDKALAFFDTIKSDLPLKLGYGFDRFCVRGRLLEMTLLRSTLFPCVNGYLLGENYRVEWSKHPKKGYLKATALNNFFDSVVVHPKRAKYLSLFDWVRVNDYLNKLATNMDISCRIESAQIVIRDGKENVWVDNWDYKHPTMMVSDIINMAYDWSKLGENVDGLEEYLDGEVL